MYDKSGLNTNSAEAQCQLANAWQLRGKIEAAVAGYQQALRLDPDYVPAYIKLGNLLINQGRIKEGLECYDRALALNPDDADLYFRRNFIKDLLEKNFDKRVSQIELLQDDKDFYIMDNPNGKINLFNQKTFKCHRSGWNFAINALKPLHNSKGILFDGFIENNFAWKHTHDGVRSAHVLERLKCEGVFDQLATSEEKGIVPYTRPWVGFIHNPQGMPAWFHYQESPQTIFAKDIWKRSLDYCLGLFTFSEYHAKWLREKAGKPVSTLISPTEIPELQFDFERFLANPQKKVIQIGWWLRRLSAIYQLPLARSNRLNYEKIRLVPMFFDNAVEYLKGLMKKEIEINNLEIDPKFSQNTREMIHVSDSEYDKLLSENIAFVTLYDASANNAVVECLARATPLLINPLPAIVEYLGEDYPMYFSSLSEAAKKALDTSLILDTHNYLKRCEIRDKLSAEYFLNSFKKSEVYQSI